MKQSQWKKHIESIEAELLKRGRETSAAEILQQFGRRLSSTIQQFFSGTDSFVPGNSLTVEQHAFTHSLQLYDMKSVMRLVANYDATKGLKVVLPGIEKSYRSLMVIPQLKPLTKNSSETTALDEYKLRLEKALSEVLDCRKEDLYEEDVLAEKMIVVSSAATEELKKKFFSERLRTLFSTNYRIYLMLKNRYFLHRLKRFGKNPDAEKLQKIRLAELTSQLHKHHDASVGELVENTDFRVIEHLVKEQISKSAEKLDAKSDSKELRTEGETQDNCGSKSRQTEQKEVIQPISVIENRVAPDISFETIIQENTEDTMSAFDQLCETYSEPLEELSASIGPVPECSSPYFLSRVEEYRDDFANYFRQMHGGDMQVNAAVHNFTLELLIQRGKEYNAAERWGVISKCRQEYQSIYFRPTEDDAAVLDRKAEWNMLMHARLPFMFNVPLEKNRIIGVEKDKLFIFQIGTAFFDQNHQSKLDQYPDTFYKLMFGGHLLANKNAVIYVEEEPYFTTTLEQMWRCRGLVYLFLIAISQRFAIELSPAMQDYLVEVLPKTLQVNGEMPDTASFPDVPNKTAVN